MTPTATLMACDRLRMAIAANRVAAPGLATRNDITGNSAIMKKSRGAIATVLIPHRSANTPPASAPRQPVIPSVTEPSMAVEGGRCRVRIA